ncbi:MAG: hypothetical protein DRI93_00035 [Aquificota bacterium]|nr:MAG: hypothetical protein B6U83_00770 [Thermoplasmatales archaeon ex4484_36]RLD96716.1 MAG: hypothetical protein DRI93_00035 [Aquificota bacterium]RLF70688.1 MAG: hypothetical protein DRN40_04045 [Thermoplasmata archaeon]
MAEVHKLRLKMGDIEIELEGDKNFVRESFGDMKHILSATGLKIPEMPKMEAPAVVKEIAVEKVAEEAKPKRRRGRPRKTEVVKAAEAAVEEKKPAKRRGRKKKAEAEAEKKVDITSVKSLPELFKLKSPAKEGDKILLMAYWINKVLKKREFRASDIKELYKELKMDPPKNISYYLRKLSSDKMGLLMPGKKKGRYKISNLGIIYLS